MNGLRHSLIGCAAPLPDRGKYTINRVFTGSKIHLTFAIFRRKSHVREMITSPPKGDSGVKVFDCEV
jgi:hypothetical protein